MYDYVASWMSLLCKSMETRDYSGGSRKFTRLGSNTTAGVWGKQHLDAEGFPEIKITFMPGFRMFKKILAAISMGT